MNFVAYGGRLRSDVQSYAAPTEVDWRDHNAHGRLFASWFASGRAESLTPASASTRDTRSSARFYRVAPLAVHHALALWTVAVGPVCGVDV